MSLPIQITRLLDGLRSCRDISGACGRSQIAVRQQLPTSHTTLTALRRLIYNSSLLVPNTTQQPAHLSFPCRPSLINCHSTQPPQPDRYAGCRYAQPDAPLLHTCSAGGVSQHSRANRSVKQQHTALVVDCTAAYSIDSCHTQLSASVYAQLLRSL